MGLEAAVGFWLITVMTRMLAAIRKLISVAMLWILVATGICFL